MTLRTGVDSIRTEMEIFSAKSFRKNHRRPLAALDRVRESLQALSLVHETDQDGPVTSLIKSLVRLAGRFQDRLELGLDSPLLTAVIGATGTGKSKVFNSLLGAPLSPSGFKRPTTMAPVFLASSQESHLLLRPSFFSEYEKRPAGEGPVSFRTDNPKELIVLALESFEYPGLILIDTPDFDSVLESNRAEARDVFDRAEAIVFVTDAIKYADQASWDYLDLIRTRDKEAILVANRIKNPLSLEDFILRLREAGLDREVLSFPDEPGLNDLDLFSTDYPAMVRLQDKLKKWSREERQKILLKEAQADWTALESGLTSELLPELTEASEELGRLEQELSAALARTNEGLARSLSVTISGELKNSLVSQIQALFVKWDLLRYPRRLMALPFTLIRDRVLAPLGLVEGRGDRRSGLAHEVDRLFETNQETMVAVIHDLNRQAAEIFASAEVGKSLADKGSFARLPLSADQVRQDYVRVRRDLETYVARQAQELVKGLNLGEKMTFYLAQMVSLGLFISIQVHTGGGFSFFDGLIDTVMAPLMSKLAGSALSREKVKAFEEEAGRRHLEGCRGLVESQAQAYMDFVAESQRGLAASLPLSEAALELTRAVGSLT